MKRSEMVKMLAQWHDENYDDVLCGTEFIESLLNKIEELGMLAPPWESGFDDKAWESIRFNKQTHYCWEPEDEEK
jgi:hypothetical protein